MTRTIYLIRHAERMDGLDVEWKKKFGNEFQMDNSPLSAQGHKQCLEIAKWFENIEVDHIFTSPFDRTLDTATRMIGDRTNLKIKPEAGFIEALYLCCTPPGLRNLDILKKVYPLIDETYDPVINPWRDGWKKLFPGDDVCTPYVKKTIESILNKYEGNIAIVSHGQPIAATLQVLSGEWIYVGQANVSKLVEKEDGKFENVSIADHTHLSDKSNLRTW